MSSLHLDPPAGRRASDRSWVPLPGRLIVLEGPDAVGKTTLAGRLQDLSYEKAVSQLEAGPQQSPRPRVFISRRQISLTSEYAATLMRQLANALWHSGDSTDLPDSFWVGLQAAWFTAHATNVVEPILKAGYDVLVDGWVYKFWSKLMLQGYRREDLETIFAEVRKPDAVILLRADVGALYDRKNRGFRPSELGMHAGYRELNRATYVEYQRQGLQQLQLMAERSRWPVLDIEPSEDAGTTTARLARLLQPLRTERGLMHQQPDVQEVQA